MKIQYDVLSAILEHEFVSRGVELLVLPATTLMPSFGKKPEIKYLQLHFKELEKSTIRDYIHANIERSAVEPLFDLTIPFIIVSDEEQNAIFNTGGWEEFFCRYPASKGQISVSKVGFNPEKTQALACVGIQSQSRSGYGSFFLVEKDVEQWSVKKSIGAWIS